MSYEILPYQNKRRKKIAEGSVEALVFAELHNYYKKNFPSYAIEDEYVSAIMNKDGSPVNAEPKVTLVGSFTMPKHLSISTLAQVISRVTSPQYIEDKEIPWTLSRLESPVLIVFTLKRLLSLKKALNCLPAPYRAMITDVYTNKHTLAELSTFLGSKKRGKKYLRIFQKRLGIFSVRKPPFKQKEIGVALAPKSPAKT